MRSVVPIAPHSDEELGYVAALPDELAAVCSRNTPILAFKVEKVRARARGRGREFGSNNRSASNAPKRVGEPRSTTRRLFSAVPADSGMSRWRARRRAPLPPAFNRLAWSNLAAQSAEQVGLAAAPIVAVLALGAGAGETGILQTAQTLPFLLLAIPLGVLA